MTNNERMVVAMSHEIAALKSKLAATENIVCALDDGSVATSQGILILTQQVQKVMDRIKVMETRFWGEET